MSPAFSARALSVRDLIAARARSRSRPKHRDDPHTLALCIEGGAMRGVVSAGMGVALEQLGLLDLFDRVYGASARPLHAALLVPGQAGLGPHGYLADHQHPPFIHLARPLGKRPH